MSTQPILVATDLSARADRAVDRAFLLGRQLSRPVVAVHVAPFGEAGEEAEVERRLRAVLPVDAAAEAQIVIEHGSAPDMIAQVAEQRDAAIICAGVARHNSIGDYLLGTSIDYLCRRCARPLLVVRNRPCETYETIIFPTDFSACSRSALLKALHLFPEARFRLIHAWHVPYAGWNRDRHVEVDYDRIATTGMDELIETFAESPQIAARLQGSVARGNLFQAIYELAEETGANLVAFGTHGESGFRHSTIGSMANELLNRLTIDSVIIRG